MSGFKSTEPTLAIGEVARQAGIPPSAIRYYERAGVLPAAPRSNGRRRYDVGILQLLSVIAVSKRAGFSLEEIKQLLHGFDHGAKPSECWRTLAEKKRSELDATSPAPRACGPCSSRASGAAASRSMTAACSSRDACAG